MGVELTEKKSFDLRKPQNHGNISDILSVTSVKIRVKSCDSDDESNSVVESVYIEPCDHDPCHLKQGTTYKMLLNFTSRVKSTTLTSHVCGKIAFRLLKGLTLLPISTPIWTLKRIKPVI